MPPAKTPLPSAAAAGRTARRQAERVPHHDSYPWLARTGLVARGVVFGVIGILALKLALGSGGKATDAQGALQTIAKQTFGKELLIVLALGLAGYATWRFVRAALGHGRDDTDTTGERIGALASAITYTAIFGVAVAIIAGSGSSSGSSSPPKETAGVLGWPAGPELVAIAGIVLFGVGVYQLYKGISRTFLETTDTAAMSRKTLRGYTVIGVVGHAARGVVFALSGYGVTRAAIDYDPKKAIGLDGALRDLAHATYGPWLLGIVSGGLICFAAYSIADGRYRKV